MPSLVQICPTCPSLTSSCPCSPIPSFGPTPSRLLFLGAGPGKTEARTRIPYSGLAGDELNGLYLQYAGLTREEVHVSNASQCWDETDRTPPESRVLACAATHLPSLLSRVQPEVLVLMGGVTQKIADKKIRLEMHHGFPQWTSILGGVWEGWVFPSYEPALGMRETSRMTQLIEDFRRLGQWLRGEWEVPEDRTDLPLDYRLIETPNELLDYLGEDFPDDRLFFQPAGDTERHGEEPWSFQFSRAARTGAMVLAGNRAVLKVLAEWVGGQVITLHNQGQDLDLMERLGLIPLGATDTQQEAFQLCSLPQGLKPLAYRLLHLTMTSWEDTVWPASVDKLINWIGEAVVYADEHLADAVVHPLVRGRCVRCGHQHTKGPCKRKECLEVGGCLETEQVFEWMEKKPGAVENILKHVARYTLGSTDDEKPYHPWKKLRTMRTGGLRGKVPGEGEWREVEEACGKIPILGIGNLDYPTAVRYGCGDADNTGQVAEVLRVMRQDSRWWVDEEDWDK